MSKDPDQTDSSKAAEGGSALADWYSRRSAEWLVANRLWFARAYWYQLLLVLSAILLQIGVMRISRGEYQLEQEFSSYVSWVFATLMYCLYAAYLYLAHDRLQHCQAPQFLIGRTDNASSFRSSQWGMLAIAFRTSLPLLLPLSALFVTSEVLGMVGLFNGDMAVVFTPADLILPLETSLLALAIIALTVLRFLFYSLLAVSLFRWLARFSLWLRLACGLLALWLFARINNLGSIATEWWESNSPEADEFAYWPIRHWMLVNFIEVLLTVIILAILLGILLYPAQKPEQTSQSTPPA